MDYKLSRMKVISSTLFLYLSVFILLPSCKKKAWDEFYGRPDNLEPPIYQVLEKKGNFKNMLAAIDKAGYKATLSAAGYWTFFAPSDSAFDVYFKANNISGIAQLDSAACQKIVTYCLVYNAFRLERMSDYQSTTGWIPGLGFRRRTASYTGVYDGTDSLGNKIKVINSNRNGAAIYADADNNNKYITYFTDNFMLAKGLSAADYNYFYPNTTYTGFNVLDAVVTEKDIAAENGIIHVVNKVITTLPGIDEYLAQNPQYSEFKKIFDQFLIKYALNANMTAKYQAITGSEYNVYTKVFNAALAFAPNNENFMKLQDNDGQQNAYSIFVPTNEALEPFIKNVLLEHYNKLSDMPVNIIYDFINAHLWQTAVWPSKFATTYNVVGEEARFDPNSNITDRKILSNAIFYGTNKVQDANVFSSVYGKAYLDPAYSMMTSLLNQELKFQISNIRQRYSILMLSNDVLNAAGYFADPMVNTNPLYQWRYTPPAGGTQLTGPDALNRLLRILSLCIIPERDLNDLSGSGVVQTYGGEFIKYNANKVYASGEIATNTAAKVTNAKTAKNGTAQYLDKALSFSETTVGKHIESLGAATTSQFNYFYQYLKNATMFNATTGDITGVSGGAFYTVFIPDNAAILAAVNAGVLPGTGTAPNKTPKYTGLTPAEQFAVESFIQYHILDKKVVASDGVESGAFPTLFKNQEGDAETLFITNTTGTSMSVTDAANRISNIRMDQSNFLGNRCVIHLINNYLKYTE
ncbi:Fasciclin domain-containing protein [Chitinophaga jiangningensis]|uniref:Fasciclin domain-containing protein n=1 Tax=Chitinophaga jiangningensis TaxID=1419482 RepID=A0A1M6YXN9_9BACT|nr:fasciclin domain-containing protein [Chitinophaga jiangningensis]SHL23046.1 Fasciclin domain-containing protein [Chitinophaga jiangningensis]